MDIHEQRILIIDFGSQYTELIARRVREIGVYCEIHPFTIQNEMLLKLKPSGIILSGGPETVNTSLSPRAPEMIFSLGCPVLGICYGMQTIAQQLGGKVQTGEKREFGYAQVALRAPSRLLLGIEDHLTEDGLFLLDVWMSHGDQVISLPEHFKTIASTSNCAIAGMACEERKIYGLQFHPEVVHTRQGKRILERFLFEICALKANWTPKNIIDEQIQKIKQVVGKDGVVLGLSGGVDSSVAAALLHKAIGDQLTCLFVDTGLLRKNEAEHVKAIFDEHFGIQLFCIDAKEKFFTALANINDPETKRKMIGKTFIEVFEEQTEKFPHVKWLGQGTIYSDVIESAATQTGKAHVIKSHHNVGGLPQTMRLSLLEPLRELFKDEVRQIGIELGLPYELVYRHPFPGPGLGVRVLGEIRKNM